MLNQNDILRDRYRVIKRLGQGGMGAVYEAHDNVFDTSVALKEVIVDISSAFDTKAQEMAQAAFEREAKLLAKINHENIPHVKDYFIEDNDQFLVMELVDGDDLGKLLKERDSAFPIETLQDWCDQLLDALDYLHSQDPPIIHRDIKPQNLKLTTRKKIKLLDFGIAKGTESLTANTVTNQTFIAATLNYSPIEQMIRVLDPTFLAVITHKYETQVEPILLQNADNRTDLFGLGATLYHLATNKHPAEAIKRGVEVWDGRPDPLEDPRALNPLIPDDFAEFLLKSMQISRDHRFSSASEMRSRLHQIMDVTTKTSLSPSVEMDYTPLKGDATVPFISMPAAPDKPAPQTSDLSAGAKATEYKTEVLKVDTAKDHFPAVSDPTAISGKAGSVPPSPEPPKKGRSKLLWLIPVAGILLFVFAGGVLGILVVVSQFGSSSDNSNVSTTESSPEITPEPDITNEPIVDSGETADPDPLPTTNAVPAGPGPQPSATVRTSEPRNPTPPPARPSTPRPQPARTAPPRTPRPTPRKTPKNMDCVFTDSCR